MQHSLLYVDDYYSLVQPDFLQLCLHVDILGTGVHTRPHRPWFDGEYFFLVWIEYSRPCLRVFSVIITLLLIDRLVVRKGMNLILLAIVFFF